MPGVSNDVRKLSLEDNQIDEQNIDVNEEVQIVGEVQYTDTKIRKNRKPTQRKE